MKTWHWMMAVGLLLLSSASPARADHGADCVSTYGVTACGYDCTANYGEVACASTPLGACLANYGDVVCWDPAWWVSEWSSAPAECLANYGTIACGYDCVANYGEVKCAETPWGRCVASYGQVTCWDPPPPEGG